MKPRLGLIRFSPLSLLEAEVLSDRLEDGAGAAPLAVSLNEVEEDSGRWEVLAYFPDAATASTAASAIGRADVSVSSSARNRLGSPLA